MSRRSRERELFAELEALHARSQRALGKARAIVQRSRRLRGPDDPAAPARLRALAVNDHDASRYVWAVGLRRAGFEVVEARGGHEALALAHAHPPDCVVVDVRLHDELDGGAVCRALRADPTTAGAVIVLTSVSEQALAAAAPGSDADDVLWSYLAEDVVACVTRATQRRARAPAP